MYWTDKHVLACTASHCAQKGANEVIGKLRLDILRKGLDKQILVNNCGTIDLCDIGPNIVVYPDNVILSGVTTKDVKRVVDYLKGGPVPEDLVLTPESEAEKQRHDCFETVLESANAPTRQAFEEITSGFGFEPSWTDEQARRGFIAIKPGPDDERIVEITKKAIDRYGLA